MPIRLALYQPDIPQNAGTMIRMAACLNVAVDVIEPCGFVFSHKGLKRAGMDYMETAELIRHDDYTSFRASNSGRLVLLSSKADAVYTDFKFAPNDCLMVGRESAGVPGHVAGDVDAAVTIPMAPGMRSLNVAVSAAMVLGEALRQTGGFNQP